MIDSRLK